MKVIITILTSLLFVFGTLQASADIITDLRPAMNAAAAAHGIDPVLMEAIIRIESGHGKSKAARNKNNLAGIMGRRSLRSYSSKEACIQDLARILGKYKARGRVTVAQIARTYCASHAKWTRAVSSNMRNIRAGKWGMEHLKTQAK